MNFQGNGYNQHKIHTIIKNKNKTRKIYRSPENKKQNKRVQNKYKYNTCIHSLYKTSQQCPEESLQ